MAFTPSRLTALLLVAGLSGVELGVLDGATGSSARVANAQSSLSLRIRRGQNGVEVVVLGVGAQPVLEQRLNGQIWEGRLQTQGMPGVASGQQQVSDPAAGLQRVAISGSGRDYRIEVVPQPGQTLQEPVVKADGRNLVLHFAGLITAPSLQTGLIDLTTPGAVPQTQYAPPLRPRAVAPPLGDMAVGTMVLQNGSFVNISGPPVTLTLNNAPAKDALMALARLGGYGYVHVPDPKKTNQSQKNGNQSSDAESNDENESKVSVFFKNETYSRALNSLLVSSGMQAKLQGNTLFVGRSLSKISLGSSVSKIVRLNQVESDAAAEYLSTLGAEFCNAVLPGQYESKTDTEYSFDSGLNVGDDSESSSESSSNISPGETEIQCYGKEDSSGPLYGITGTHDQRLNTITIVGESRLVGVAQQYLKMLDLRKRQVAVKVQILNIDLRNDKDINSSFSASIGNTFLVSESGRAFVNFGEYRPGSSAGSGLLGNGTPYATPGTYSAGVPRVAAQNVVPPSVAAQNVINPSVAAQNVINPSVEAQSVINPSVESQTVVPPSFEAQDVVPPYVPELEDAYNVINEDGSVSTVEVPYIDPVTKQKVYVTDPNPNAPSQLIPRLDSEGRPVYVPSTDPSAEQVLLPQYDQNGRPIYVPSTDPSAQPTLIPRYDQNGRPIYVPSSDPSAQPTLIPRYDQNGRPIYVPSTDPSAQQVLTPRYDKNGRLVYVPSTDPSAQPSLTPRYDKNGRPVYVSGQDPNEFSYPKNSFYGYLEAQIVSSNAKTLASPTLLVQEGSGAKVVTGTSVIVNATETIANDITTISTERETAGLALNVDVERIDDNGFVTLSIDPIVSVPRPSGQRVGDVELFDIEKRALNSGLIRLRDRQTLVLTGVIQDADREIITKWPILGDLPFIGQLFRGTSSNREKQELVILVTPYIVDDQSGGTYGYGYRPTTRESRQLMGPR